MKVILALLIATFVFAPAFSQSLYSYRDQDGKLVITDKPVRSKKLKLVKTFTPKHIREKEKAREEELARAARHVRPDRNGRLVLSSKQIKGLAYPIAKAMEVDPELVYAVIQIESSREITALSEKGAQGLMQLIPETAKRFGVKNVWDPRQNIRGGVAYLRYLLSYFEGDVDLVLAAYNAGENAVDRHGGIPPYKETRRYVKKIRKLYDKETIPYVEKAAKRHSRLVAQKTNAVASAKTNKKRRSPVTKKPTRAVAPNGG